MDLIKTSLIVAIAITLYYLLLQWPNEPIPVVSETEEIIELNTLDILKKEYIPNSITTPMVYDLNNKNNIQSLGCTVNSLLLTTKNLKNLNSFNKIDYISGVSLFFDKNVLKINGNLPEKYFMYYEDVDWCKKATNNDIKLIISIT